MPTSTSSKISAGVSVFCSQMFRFEMHLNLELTVWHGKSLHALSYQQRQFISEELTLIVQLCGNGDSLLVMSLHRFTQFGLIGFLIIERLLFFEQLAMMLGQFFRPHMMLTCQIHLTR